MKRGYFYPRFLFLQLPFEKNCLKIVKIMEESAMNFFIGLLVGLIVGWVIEWLIDWRFWRRDDEQVRKQLAEAQAKISELQQEADKS